MLFTFTCYSGRTCQGFAGSVMLFTRKSNANFHGISWHFDANMADRTPPGARVTRRRCQAGDEAKQVGPSWLWELLLSLTTP